MASTTNLRGTKVETGQAQKEVTINGLFDLLDAAGHGKLDVTITTANVTLTGTPAAPQAQNKYFNISGTLTDNRDLIFPVNDDDPAVGNPRVIVVKNGTSGSFTVTVKVSGQTGVTVTQGTTAILLHNGTDFVKLHETGGSGTVTSFSATPSGIFDVANPTSTPALSLDNQNANIVLAGPGSGGAATPAFRSLVTADLPALIGARVTHSTTQSIGNTTDDTVNFDSERWDTDTIHDNATNNWRLTSKTAGYYLIVAEIGFAANGTGIRQVSIKYNGTPTIIARSTFASSGGSFPTRVLCSTIYFLAVNDYVFVTAFQDSGGR